MKFSHAFLKKPLLLVFIVIFFAAACAGMDKGERAQRAAAHYQLGLSYLNDNNIQPAFIEFQKAIDLNPGNKEVLNAIGVIYLSKLEDYPKAIDHFQKALRIDSNYSEASNNLGIAYEKTGKLNAAIESYSKALSNPLYRNPEKAFNNLGRAYYRARKYSDAVGAYQEAVKRFSDFYPSYYGLTLCYNAMGRYGDAATALKKAIELNPAYKGDREKAEKDMRERKILLKGDEEKDIEDLLEIMNY